MSFTVGTHIEYTPREAHARCLQGALILDIRPEVLCMYKAFDVPEVVYCPWKELIGQMEKLPADREIIVADSSGIQGREAMDLLLTNGFSQVAGLAGGMVEWERDGMPILTDNQSRLSGGCMCQLKFREKRK
jgi:rhodanese-related sulfurtransferase